MLSNGGAGKTCPDVSDRRRSLPDPVADAHRAHPVQQHDIAGVRQLGWFHPAGREPVERDDALLELPRAAGPMHRHSLPRRQRAGGNARVGDLLPPGIARDFEAACRRRSVVCQLGCRYPLLDSVQKLRHPGPGARRPANERHDLPLPDLLSQRRQQHGIGHPAAAALERLDHPVVELGQQVGNWLAPGWIDPVEGADPRPGIARIHRPVQWYDPQPQLAPQIGQHLVGPGAHAVDLVDEDEQWPPGHARRAGQLDRLRLHALDRRNDQDDRIEHP